MQMQYCILVALPKSDEFFLFAKGRYKVKRLSLT